MCQYLDTVFVRQLDTADLCLQKIRVLQMYAYEQITYNFQKHRRLNTIKHHLFPRRRIFLISDYDYSVVVLHCHIKRKHYLGSFIYKNI